MCPIQDRTGFDSKGSTPSQGRNIGTNSERFALVKQANKKVKLYDILRHYKLPIKKNFQRPKWSENIRCPFPHHNEINASFGYCFTTDHFTCLGCGKSGRAVEFVSLMERSSRNLVAQQILEQYESLEDLVYDDFQDESDQLSEILLDGAAFLRNIYSLVKNDKQKLAKVEKLTWWLDVYLTAKAPAKLIKPEDLKYRIERVKELLSDEMLDIR